MTLSPAIETELREVQQRATELQRKAKSLNEQVDQILRQKSSKNIKISRNVNEHLEKENKKDLRKLLEQDNCNVLRVSQEVKNTSTEKNTEMDINNSVTNTSSEDSDTEKKYLELIDLLTVKMFDNEPETGASVGGGQPSKKSHSLPRTLDMAQSRLQKSSSQHFSGSGSGLTAYERLFGRPRPGEQTSRLTDLISG